MAQKTQVILVDDVDGSEANQTVTFALDGVSYEIDLNDEHAAALRESLEEWIGKARRTGGRRSSGRRRSSGPSDTQKIREWAREQGLESLLTCARPTTRSTPATEGTWVSGSHAAGTPHRVILELTATSHHDSGCALRRITGVVVFSIREFAP